jgi:1-acyl-sn-glycerol-3-phosphate acyltransferase
MRALALLRCYLLLPLRLSAVLIVTLLGLCVQLIFFTWVKPRTARRIVALWSRTMLACLGVRLLRTDARIHARTDDRKITRTQVVEKNTALFVSNHVSWLDILVLQASAPVVFVAKSEIKSWPVLGWMVALAGTCFIHRERRTALRGVHTALTAHLLAGQSVCIFPEGTTSDGTQVLPFHGGLLQAAIDAQVAVQPMRLDYSDRAAAYVGDITLLGSVGNILLTPHLQVHVQALPAIAAPHEHRQAIAAKAHQTIEVAGHPTTAGLLA